jgi:diguanylate cyclase (GGDEF)-like protein
MRRRMIGISGVSGMTADSIVAVDIGTRLGDGPDAAEKRDAAGGFRLPFLSARQGARSRRMVLAGMIALSVVSVATTTILTLHERGQALDDANTQASGLALVLANQTERIIDAVETLQAGLLDGIRQADIRTPEAFRMHMTGLTAHNDLRVRASLLPQLDAITAIADDGTLINFSRYWPIPTVNVADRDYFKALKADPQRLTFLSMPVPNRGTGTWTLYLARKVTGPDGRFLGLLLGAMELSYFERIYQSVSPGAGASISLFRDDGIQLARFPHVEPSIGKVFAAPELFRATRAEPGAAILQHRASLTDGTDRLYVAHHMARHDMVVVVANTVDTVLAPWRRQTGMLIGATAVLLGLIASAGAMILRELRHQSRLAAVLTAKAQAEQARLGAEAELAVASARAWADQERHAQDQRFGVAMNNISQAMCMFDTDDRLVVANARFATLFNLPQTGLTQGVPLDMLLPPGEEDDSLAGVVRQLRRQDRRAGIVREIEDGRSLAVNYQSVAGQGWLLTLEDVSERREAEARIAHMAHHDALTGLPNRVLFNTRLNEALARSRRGDPFAVLCLDLDHFKAVNDTLGHPIGDALLREVTARLTRQVRELDTVARLGGDEFAIIQTSVDQPRDATALANRLIEALSAPYEIDGHQVVIGTSVGISVVPDDGNDADQLLKNADLALYRAKADGRGRYRFFEPEMDAWMQARRLMEIDLRRALTVGEFEIYYQPLMNMQTRTVSSFEALLRWHHPTRGMVAPSEFIPLAEEIGLIVPLGDWVLNRACIDAASWPDSVGVAVNLSVVQFGHRSLVGSVQEALQLSGLAPQRLELEITESVMILDNDATMETLHGLRALGVRIAMDDFGTGYSSLSYLRRFPFDKVKIDRSFIEGLGQGGDCDAIVSAVTSLCDRLGMTTTAEGVETREQLDQLGTIDCTEVQGYLISRPRPASEVAALCRSIDHGDLVALLAK